MPVNVPAKFFVFFLTNRNVGYNYRTISADNIRAYCREHRGQRMERIYNQLRDDVTLGRFQPGEHLSEKLLTEVYGVSRMTIREVIGQLAKQGYLKIEKNRGAIVTKLTIDDIDNIYNVLERCESYAVKLFTERQSKNVIKKLETLHEKMQEARIKEQPKLWHQLNDEFHGLIYANCGSTIVSDLIFQIRLRPVRYRNVVKLGPKFINIYIKQHGRILAAIRKGDSELADRMMFEHLSVANAHRIDALRDLSLSL